MWSSSFPKNKKSSSVNGACSCERTLERIDVESFVLPRQLLSFEKVLDVRPLGVVRGDDAEGHVPQFIQPSELHDNMSFFTILLTSIREPLKRQKSIVLQSNYDPF